METQVDSRVERQRAVMRQLADMRQSASSLQKRVARLTGDVHPRMLAQVCFLTSTQKVKNNCVC